MVGFGLSALGQFALAGALGVKPNSPFTAWIMLLGAIGVSAGAILTIRGAPQPSHSSGSIEKKFWPFADVMIGAMSALLAGLCVQLLSELWNSGKSSTLALADWPWIIITGIVIVGGGGFVMFWLTKLFVALFKESAPKKPTRAGVSKLGKYLGNFIILIIYLMIGWAVFRRN